MKRIIVPGQTIGIIGGGQLGRMMAIAAKEMGYKIAVLDPVPKSPCGQIADTEIVAVYNDLAAIRELAKISDVITYEFENIDYDCLHWLEQNAYLPQGSKLLKLTQNRFTEKNAIIQAGIPVAAYRLIRTEQDLLQGIEDFGYPCVLKTTTGGYDGKGQVVLRGKEDIGKAKELVEMNECILEDWVPFAREISVIVVRGVTGETKMFPVAENIHVDNILHKTIVPARLSAAVEKQALECAETLANELGLIGTLAVEMFVTEDNRVYVNELAPRPHNSGHYTMNACETSQFEQHIRAVCGWPLGMTTLLKPVVMVNILGEHIEGVLQNLEQFSGCKLHLYGKAEAKERRKMGHLNILAENTEIALQKACALQIWDREEQVLEVKK
ncbi:MAG: 5-(carboxyamino)imidazole ribonucleotide synthase [Ectobacillus sp.]